MIINKYNKKCQSCNILVGPGKGFAYKNGFRWFTVCNSSACLSKLGLKVEQKEKPVRKLNVDGTIEIPYDRLAIPLLRSFPSPEKPKKKFDPETKIWATSVKPENLPRVLELAKKLNLEIPEELILKANKGIPELLQAEQRAQRNGLYDFQREGVKFLTLHKRALLADDQGLGKTIQTLVALPENPRVIVVCPASVKYNWQNETNKWRPEIKTILLEGKNSFGLPQENEMIIINSDILTDELEDPSFAEAIKEYIEKIILVVDEAQTVKNYKTKRSKKIKNLSKNCLYTWFLTGTPLMNKPPDLYGILSSANIYLCSWNKYVELFNGYKGRFGYTFGDPDPELSERLKNVLLRRKKSDVLKDLPNKQYKTIVVDFDNKETSKELDLFIDKITKEQGLNKENFSSKKDLLNELNFNILPDFKVFNKVRSLLALSKVSSTIEIISSYEESNEPVIVFSSFKKPVRIIGSRDGWRYIDGDTPTKIRQEIIDEFQSGKLKGVALTIKTAGFGITLTRSSNVIFNDPDYTAMLNIQAEDRTHRIGQKNNVQITYLTSNHPLDIHLSNLIQRKLKIARKALESSINFKPIKQYDTPEIRQETMEELQIRLENAEKEANKEIAKSKISAILGRELARSAVPEPELTPARIQLIREALKYMVSRCDRAMTRDYMGFNKPDAAIGHWLLDSGLEDDDQISIRVAERILSRYSKQLEVKYKEIWNPKIT